MPRDIVIVCYNRSNCDSKSIQKEFAKELKK